ncbi:hypothetical protein CWI36_0534p0020 [Hamiltosporidium magnivora]|uniref:Uncharacterized protein n=1 Tax=Hamiltosporidium magnivora TaxID=148818 RepID=A0A4V2JVZ8_9MICR|nr:hypothetical protein CWI36_0534p0020 [Hamiltosporidium magnivora]
MGNFDDILQMFVGNTSMVSRLIEITFGVLNEENSKNYFLNFFSQKNLKEYDRSYKKVCERIEIELPLEKMWKLGLAPYISHNTSLPSSVEVSACEPSYNINTPANSISIDIRFPNSYLEGMVSNCLFAVQTRFERIPERAIQSFPGNITRNSVALIKTNVKIRNNRTEIFILDKKKNITLFEVGIDSQNSLQIAEPEKLRNYDFLANELGLIYRFSFEIIPYVVTCGGISIIKSTEMYKKPAPSLKEANNDKYGVKHLKTKNITPLISEEETDN